MQKLPGMSLNELYWKISWPVLLRIISDLPSQRYLGDEEDDVDPSKKSKIPPRKLTEQTSKDFAQHIKELNEKNKRK